MHQMPKLALFSVFFATAAMAGPSDSADSRHQIMLCVDDSAKAGDVRLLYSYIDGKKTKCLPEQELRELLSRARFEQRQDSLDAEKKKDGDYYVELIRHGERDLAGADLRMADLMDSQLDSANLKNADLSNADLRNASLQGADLSGAKLTVAYCRRTDFRGAKLDGADVTGAYLYESDLRGATGLSFEMLKTARTLYKTRMDSTLLASVEEGASEKLREPKQGWVDNRWAPPPDERRKNGRR